MINNEEKSCAIVLNGESIEREIEDDFIICADGGAKLLKGRLPDIIIGDSDSLSATPKGVKTLNFPAIKNETDGELCVRYAAKEGFKRINFYGVLGGRADHILGNYTLLALADKLGCVAVAREKGLDIHFAKSFFTLETNKNDTLSVVPFGGCAVIKQSAGLFYPLENLVLEPFLTRGISNIATESKIILEFEKGVAIVFHYHLKS